MATLRMVLGDQLSQSLASLKNINKEHDCIFMCEVLEEATYVKHHPKKIAFIFAAMRHFAHELEKKNFKVRYVKLDNPNNTGSFDEELTRTLKVFNADKIVLTHPGEWRVLEKFKRLQNELNIPITLLEDDRFLCSQSAFKAWTEGKKQYRMEYFYREMRLKYNLLIKNKKPVGGQWNFDKQNRKSPDKDLKIATRQTHQPDEITQSVLKLVKEKFSHHFGDLEPFDLAVTRRQALNEATSFMENILPLFGDYQDAMQKNEPFLNHSRLSFYLNAGLLLPLELCQMAEEQYQKAHAPIHCVEGFIRQILGWREYIRGIYWLFMPQYRNNNFLKAKRPLPDLYWGGKTQMACLAEAVKHTQNHAYSHHIQRLMVTGNFALLAGILPDEVCEWYLAVYADAYEWVELPNTLGMALFGDGGLLASKPYAASGKYIQRMSNFCDDCVFNPKENLGEDACPFNALYWDFLARHQDRLKDNPRLKPMYLNWSKMDKEKQQALLNKAQESLNKLAQNKL